jgi:DNA-binding IclR family transcriptional regulator
MVSATDRVLSVLTVMADEPEGLFIGELASRCKLAKPTAHRIVLDLIARGFVRRVGAGGRYALTLELTMLAARFVGRLGFLDLCQPELDRLAAAASELVRLAWCDGDRLVFVSEAQGTKAALRFDENLGRVARLGVTAVGKCFLAALPRADALKLAEGELASDRPVGPKALTLINAIDTEITRVRRQGYAIAADESALGVSAVAVSILTRGREPKFMGSIAIVGPTVRLPRSRLESLVPELRISAEAIARHAPLARFCDEGGQFIPSSPPA